MSPDEMASHELGWLFASAGRGRGRPRPRPEDLERLAALQRIGGGPFGGHFFGQPFRGGRGRRRRGDVRVALLMLLAEEPRNGYQLMQVIEERSGGRWRPSPGSVYPTLAQLEDEGLIHAAERDGTKLFELTDAGRAYLEDRGEGAAPWTSGDEPAAEDFVEIKLLLVEVAKAASEVAQMGDERQAAQASETLRQARRSLYRILAEDADA